jgi:hypothetical protein
MVSGASIDLPVEEIERRMPMKFAYLKGATGIAAIQHDLERLFERFDVQVIAPAHGCVIVGDDAVNVICQPSRASSPQWPARTTREQKRGEAQWGRSFRVK